MVYAEGPQGLNDAHKLFSGILTPKIAGSPSASPLGVFAGLSGCLLGRLGVVGIGAESEGAAKCRVV